MFIVKIFKYPISFHSRYHFIMNHVFNLCVVVCVNKIFTLICFWFLVLFQIPYIVCLMSYEKNTRMELKTNAYIALG